MLIITFHYLSYYTCTKIIEIITFDIIRVIIIIIYCIGLIIHFLLKYSFFVILPSISYLILILALNPSILGGV